MTRDERKLRRLEDELADVEHWLGLWGRHFGTEPSRKRRQEEIAEDLRRKIAELKLKLHPVSDDGRSPDELDAWTVADDLRILRQHLGYPDGELMESERAFDRLRGKLGV